MDNWPTLVCAVAAAYVSTNVDGFALLLTFFSNSQYRPVEVVAGQFISVAAQLAMSASVVQSSWVTAAPCIGLSGVVPLVAGLTGIAGIGQGRRRDDGTSAKQSKLKTGRAQRIFAVAIVATSGSMDNVLVYSSALLGRTPGEYLLAAFMFGILTTMLCVTAFVTARSQLSTDILGGIVRRVAPFATTAIGLSMLIRFDTLAWIYSLV